MNFSNLVEAVAIHSGMHSKVSDNMKALEKASNYLAAAISDVKTGVRDAELKGFTQTEAKRWLNVVEEINREVDEIIKRYRGSSQSFPARFFNYRSNYKISKHAAKKVMEAREMLDIIDFGSQHSQDELRHHMATIENFLKEIAEEKLLRFSREQLAGCTQNYLTKIGSGGYGTVYKGKLLNGMPVAVKVLHGNLDESAEQTFMAEVSTIGRTYHLNLVRLLGFCFDHTICALVYEYVEKGALDKLLFKDDIARSGLSFSMLHEIAIGIAKGIRYLHEECHQKIIHYDIKPQNILLDDKFTPKVADFGLAMLLNRENTHGSISGRVGTLGYAAPETWKEIGTVTEACDVYSFGMILFEIVMRRKNFVKGSNLPRTVWERYDSSLLAELIEESHGMMDEEERRKAERMCKVALWCVQYEPNARPPMSKVVMMLEGDIDISPPANPFQHLVEPIVDLALLEMSSININSSSISGRITEAQSREISQPPF